MRSVFLFKLCLICVFCTGNTARAAGDKEVSLFWEPVSITPVQNNNLEVWDSGFVNGMIRLGSSSQMRVVYSNCRTVPHFETVKGWTQWYVNIKDDWFDYAGLRLKLTPKNVASLWGYNELGGIYKLNSTDSEWTVSNCYQVGEVVAFSANPGDINIDVQVDRRTAIPGNYVVSVPFRYLYEEMKGYMHGWPNVEKMYQLMRAAPSAEFKIDLVVRSKCSFNTSPINLSHGTMAGRNADGNQTKPYNLNVTCTPGTSVSVKLIGSQKVSGKTNNYTKCGTGGMCELTFDNGKYDETMTIDNSKTLSIKSTYRLNDITKPVAESFEGSGVLQVLVN
ncbi:spore coat protein U domain-containing protein [Salmonella enterica]|nr:spore coat protein U domain-containing protein [Salmonella enterica]